MCVTNWKTNKLLQSKLFIATNSFNLLRYTVCSCLYVKIWFVSIKLRTAFYCPLLLQLTIRYINEETWLFSVTFSNDTKWIPRDSVRRYSLSSKYFIILRQWQKVFISVHVGVNSLLYIFPQPEPCLMKVQFSQELYLT